MYIQELLYTNLYTKTSYVINLISVNGMLDTKVKKIDQDIVLYTLKMIDSFDGIAGSIHFDQIFSSYEDNRMQLGVLLSRACHDGT